MRDIGRIGLSAQAAFSVAFSLSPLFLGPRLP